MTPNNTGAGSPRAPEMHLICSSGGSRAILASAGAILACHQAGIREWKSIGGISGGSIPTAMFAGGLDAITVVHRAVEIDFSSLLTRHGSIFQILFAYFMKDRFEKSRPRKGVLTSEKVGEYIDSTVPEFPKNYWTMAMDGTSKIVFTAEGVFEYTHDGRMIVLSPKAGPLGIAVRGSCAVPGIIGAVPYKGRYLFDGALSTEGRVPLSPAMKHFGATRDKVIAVDVGDDGNKWSKRVIRIWKFLCGQECVGHEVEDLTNEGGLVLITPASVSFRSLQFTLNRDQKWEAVMSGYIGAIKALKEAGLLTGHELERAQMIAHSYKGIQTSTLLSTTGELARQTEELLSKHGLY